MKLTPDQAAFVEHVGRWWETSGQGRTAGRILGWLMISEPPHQSAADLMGTLAISAGSVSTLIRRLEVIGLVERITFHGDRSTYYQLPPNVWSRAMDGELARIDEMRKLVLAAEDVVPTERPDRVTQLGEVAEFMFEEWPGVLARLKDHLRKVEK